MNAMHSSISSVATHLFIKLNDVFIVLNSCDVMNSRNSGVRPDGTAGGGTKLSVPNVKLRGILMGCR